MFNTLQSTNQLPCSVLNFEEHPSTPTHLHSYCAFRIVELSLHLVWLYVLGWNLVASAQKWNPKVSIHFWHCYHKATVTHFETEKNLITHKLTKFLPLKFYKRNAMPSSDNFVIFSVCESMQNFKKHMKKYASVYKNMQKYAIVFNFMQEHARLCKIMQEYARVCRISMQKHTKACKSMKKNGKACKSMWKHAKVVKACKSMQKHEKAWKDMKKHAKACKSM